MGQVLHGSAKTTHVIGEGSDCEGGRKLWRLTGAAERIQASVYITVASVRRQRTGQENTHPHRIRACGVQLLTDKSFQ